MLTRAKRYIAVLLIMLLICAPSAIWADVESCRGAIRSFKSAKVDIASAYRAYGNCVSSSDGQEDCSSEFRNLKSAQDDFEEAVSSYQTDCP